MKKIGDGKNFGKSVLNCSTWQFFTKEIRLPENLQFLYFRIANELLHQLGRCCLNRDRIDWNIIIRFIALYSPMKNIIGQADKFRNFHQTLSIFISIRCSWTAIVIINRRFYLCIGNIWSHPRMQATTSNRSIRSAHGHRTQRLPRRWYIYRACRFSLSLITRLSSL